MVAEEIGAEGSDVSEAKLETVIRHTWSAHGGAGKKAGSGSAYSANKVSLAGRGRVIGSLGALQEDLEGCRYGDHTYNCWYF